MAKKVVVVQRRLTHYRIPFFELLRKMLLAHGIELILLYGDGTTEESKKRDAAEISWAKKISNRYLFGSRLCWQPIHAYLKGADLVVVTQENGLLINHLMLLWPCKFKLAFWGHGANFQSTNPDGLSERYKRWTSKYVDWWFAYTQISADIVTAAGFPADRVTITNNTMDTLALLQQSESISVKDIMALRDKFGFGSDPVAVFVGSLYPAKRLDFLFRAAKVIRRKISGLQLLLVGDGPESEKVRAWCSEHPWAHWVGAQMGQDKALCLSMSQVMLNPGVVGISIVDAFASGIPMFTTDCRGHSPEIAYLENRYNGVMTANSLSDYARAVIQIMRDPKSLNELRTGCTKSAKKYTVQNMARRFADGIQSALGSIS